MSETKSQPTPVTDKAEKNLDRELLQYSLGEISEFPTFKTMRSLEISRDQWKAVAERLAEQIKYLQSRPSCARVIIRTFAMLKAITEFNQLKESK